MSDSQRGSYWSLILVIIFIIVLSLMFGDLHSRFGTPEMTEGLSRP